MLISSLVTSSKTFINCYEFYFKDVKGRKIYFGHLRLDQLNGLKTNAGSLLLISQ